MVEIRIFLVRGQRDFGHHEFPVTADRNELLGIVTTCVLLDPGQPLTKTAGELTHRPGAIIDENNSLRAAVDVMFREGVHRLAINTPGELHKLVAILSHSDILAAHRGTPVRRSKRRTNNSLATASTAVPEPQLKNQPDAARKRKLKCTIGAVTEVTVDRARGFREEFPTIVELAKKNSQISPRPILTQACISRSWFSGGFRSKRSSILSRASASIAWHGHAWTQGRTPADNGQRN